MCETEETTGHFQKTVSNYEKYVWTGFAIYIGAALGSCIGHFIEENRSDYKWQQLLIEKGMAEYRLDKTDGEVKWQWINVEKEDEPDNR